jgi:hypothetical protein
VQTSSGREIEKSNGFPIFIGLLLRFFDEIRLVFTGFGNLDASFMTRMHPETARASTHKLRSNGNKIGFYPQKIYLIACYLI